MRQIAIFIIALVASGTAAATESGPVHGQIVNHKRNNVLEPVHNERYEYYEVCGCSEKDLQCDLALKAIKCSDGKKYDSVTNWKVKWDYDYNRDGKACSTQSFRVTVDIVFHLPKWARDVNAPLHVVDKWDSYIKNLLIHEIGHRDRAVEAARDLTRTIAQLPPARTCSELDREVNRISRLRLNKLIADQAQYDEETSHGRSQGVLFP